MGPFPVSKGNFSAGLNSGPGPSWGVWANCPWDAIEQGYHPGWCKHYNFGDLKASSNVNAAEAFWTDGLYVFGSDGCAITNGSDSTSAASQALGYATIGSDGDNEGGYIRQTASRFKATGPHATASSRSGAFWLEWRFKTSTIADTKHGIYSGLIEDVAATATVPITAAGALADKNLIGFHRLEGDGDYLDCVYKADGVAQVTAQSDAQALVADTWVKAGLVYTPGDATVKYYGNGLQLASITMPAAPSAGTGAYPNDVQLGFIFGVLNATASTPGTSSINWARMAVLY